MSFMRAYCCRDKKKQVYPRHIAVENSSKQRNIQSMYKAKSFIADSMCYMKLKSDITLPFHLQPHIYFTACAMCGLDDRYFQCVRADLHGTIFVSCDKLTTGLRHDLRLGCTSEKCRSILKHVLKRCSNRKSCRRPAVSLSHGSNYPMIDLSQQLKHSSRFTREHT